jgi:hypothetical protein
VTGQITTIVRDVVSVKVRTAHMKESHIAAELKPYPPGLIIRKKSATLRKGNPERQLWSDESAPCGGRKQVSRAEPMIGTSPFKENRDVVATAR